MSMGGLRSVRLVLPDRILEHAWIAFEDGRIVGFGQGDLPELPFLEDGGNAYLAPGFIDLHVHGGAGADFLDASPEAFETIANFHLSGGTTALCPTLATAAYQDFGRSLEGYERVRDRIPARLLPIHLEGPHLNAQKAGAQDPRLLQHPTAEHLGWLLERAPLISQITIAPELPGALPFLGTLASAGIRISLGHTAATETDVRAAVDGGATKVTHLFNAMSSATKHGLFRQAGLTEFALAEERLACEVIADGFHVAETLLRLAHHCKGSDNLVLVSDALAGAGLPVGSPFRLGLLDCKVNQGFCTLADGSALSGSATRLIDQVRVCVTKAGISLPEAICMATRTPARLLGIDDRWGSVKPGHQADLVLFNEKFEVKQVRLNGLVASETVDAVTSLT